MYEVKSVCNRDSKIAKLQSMHSLRLGKSSTNVVLLQKLEMSSKILIFALVMAISAIMVRLSVFGV